VPPTAPTFLGPLARLRGPATLLTVSLLLPGCIAAGVNSNLGWLTGGGGGHALTYSGSLEGQIQPYRGIILGARARLLGATDSDDGPHGQLFGALGYGSWLMPGARTVEFEGTLLVGGGWVPRGNGQAAEAAFLLGPRFSLPIRLCPKAGPLWRLDRLLSIVVYLVPNLTYSAAYLPDASIWRHEIAGGLGLRFQLYSAVVP